MTDDSFIEMSTSSWPPGMYWIILYDSHGRCTAHEIIKVNS